MTSSSVKHALNRLFDRKWGSLGVELLLIVAGILIALAINDWAAESDKREAERVYLELLVRDLDRIEKNWLDRIEQEKGIASLANQAFTAIQTEQLGDGGATIGEMLTALSDRRSFSLNTPTFVDMMSTGNLSIIQNRSLRDRIIQEFSAMKQWELSIRTNDQIFVDEGFNPFLQEHGVTLRLPKSDLSAGDTWSGLLNEYFTDEMLNPRDDVLTLPKESPEWRKVERQIVSRSLCALSNIYMANNALKLVDQLRAEILQELET